MALRPAARQEGGQLWVVAGPQISRCTDEPVVAVSPTSVANTVNPGVRIVTLVGRNDRVTPPFLTRAYDDILRARSIGGGLIETDGGHDIFFDRAVLAALRALLLATAYS